MFCKNLQPTKTIAMLRCDPQEALVGRASGYLTAEQRDDVESLTDKVVLGMRPKLLDFRREHSKAIVEFMQQKEPNRLDAIKRDIFFKASRFEQVLRRTVFKLCKETLGVIKDTIEALNNWIHQKSIPDEDISGSTKSWLNVFKVCSRIIRRKGWVSTYSYNYFIGRKID